MLQTPQIRVWQGAFPPPDAVERYESVLPGAFDRLIAMAEAAQQARITVAAQANAYRQRDVSRAYWLGAAVAAFAMACASLALRMGSQTVAVVFVSVPVMAVAKALIESIRPSRQEND